MRKQPEQFFVVLRDDDTRLVRHSDGDAARDEAKRLAEKNPGHTFFVLIATEAARPATLRIEVVDCDDGLPF